MVRRTIATILLVAFLASPAAAQALVESAAEAEVRVAPAVELLPHPPIRIDGDAAFAGLLSGVRAGDGTAADPYVIERWIIPASFSVGVDLRNTRSHVLVRELLVVGETPENAWKTVCRVSDPSCRGTVGIRLDNATNVTIEHVEVFRVGDAFGIYGSADVVIRDAIVGLASDTRVESVVAGIVAERTSGLVVEDVRIRRTTFPLVIDQVTDVRIEGLDASGGIVSSLFNAERALVLGSRFHNAGIFIGGAMRDFSVVGTTFAGGNDGLGHLDLPDDYLDGGYFCGNRFERITGGNPALYLPKGEDVTVRGNSFRDMSSALWMKFTDRGVVEHNDLQINGSSTFSVAVQTTTELRMHNNSLLDGGTGVNVVGPVDARFNWWGAADGPGGDLAGSGTKIKFTFTGGTATPWLASAPDLSGVTCDPSSNGRAPVPPVPLAQSVHVAALDLLVEARVALLDRTEEANVARQLALAMGPLVLP